VAGMGPTSRTPAQTALFARAIRVALRRQLTAAHYPLCSVYPIRPHGIGLKLVSQSADRAQSRFDTAQEL